MRSKVDNNRIWKSRTISSKIAAALLGLLGLFVLPNRLALTAGEPAPETITIELRQPDRQLQRLLTLFRKSKAKHPAAALAAWKTAQRGKVSLSKRAEALIALLNPEMVGELRQLDHARLDIGPLDTEGQTAWRLSIPHDDGTFAAATVSMTLTEGATVEPIGNRSVFRLGKPGSALSITDPPRLLIASDRKQLETALGNHRPDPIATVDQDSGLAFRIVPKGLDGSNHLNLRRIRAALGTSILNGQVWLNGDRLELDSFRSTNDPFAATNLKIQSRWLDGLPADGIAMAFAWPIATDPKSLARIFEIADAVEKADPNRAELAPLRVRLNLFAAALGVRPETELWPKLTGISGALTLNERGEFRKAIVGLHTSDPDAALAMVSQTLPKLFKVKPETTPARIDGTRIAWQQREASVWIGYGEGALDDSLSALDGKSPAVSQTLANVMTNRSLARFGAVWPGRLRLEGSLGKPLSDALAASPPIVFSGMEEKPFHDRIAWEGLEATLNRWLDALPLVPPANQSQSK